MHNPSSHNVAFVGYDQIQLLDIFGPLEAFKCANRVIKSTPYHTFIVSEYDTFVSESGVRVCSDHKFSEAMNIDTLVVTGGRGTRIPAIANRCISWINEQFESASRVISVCSGVFLLGNHPYLNGKEVVTHWSLADLLQKTFPHLDVNHNRLFIKQGKFHSSAGVLTGIDLALNLIEADHGVDVATYVAKHLITYLKRSGHQSQFSEPLKFQSTNNSHIDRINRWLIDHYSDPITVSQLAENVHISERHLNRVIQGHFNMSASKYIEHIKLEQSKVYLAKQNTAVDATASMVGYASSDAFRRSFKRKYGIAPHTYQLRFQGEM
ncbi:GlxA family transcriptional regulator [Marinicella litoralis]|uniref:AraC family transcriptional regulator with amidase-like domain n=1 Tax=Marinicella litoralis TaxID=644220 RepID=A0A4R6XSJ3_9GAMM|nr:helix-turn-helix domain-containing protein [Marinicella litoralis]TDR20363.1 AraC family transcriptional regulator with amidase-like domain [Marinicella litoralis]